MDLYSDAAAFPRTLRGHATVLTTADLEAEGITEAAAWWRVRRKVMLRPHRGVYLAGVTTPDLLDRIRAALAVSPPDAIIGFHTAAALHGFGVVEDARIHLVVPPGSSFPFRQGIRVHQSVLHQDEPVSWREIACTAPARTAIDLARVLRRPQALSILDCALHVTACDLEELRNEVSRHRGLAGVRRVRALLDLADGRAQCAQETHLRLLLRDSGLTSFVPQWPVPGPRGRTRYVLDLADPERRRRVRRRVASGPLPSAQRPRAAQLAGRCRLADALLHRLRPLPGPTVSRPDPSRGAAGAVRAIRFPAVTLGSAT